MVSPQCGHSNGKPKRYVVCLNEDEVKRRRSHRSELTVELEDKLRSSRGGGSKTASKLLTSRRFDPYLSMNGKGKLYIDQEKIAAAERLDGKFVVESNDESLSVQDVAKGYKGLWIIESCFHRIKSSRLRVRPMIHYANRRIEAHVRFCVLVLIIQRLAERRTGMTWRRIAESVYDIHAVRIEVENKSIVRSTEIKPEHEKLMKTLGIPVLRDIHSIDDIK